MDSVRKLNVEQWFEQQLTKRRLAASAMHILGFSILFQFYLCILNSSPLHPLQTITVTWIFLLFTLVLQSLNVACHCYVYRVDAPSSTRALLSTMLLLAVGVVLTMTYSTYILDLTGSRLARSNLRMDDNKYYLNSSYVWIRLVIVAVVAYDVLLFYNADKFQLQFRHKEKSTTLRRIVAEIKASLVPILLRTLEILLATLLFCFIFGRFLCLRPLAALLHYPIEPFALWQHTLSLVSPLLLTACCGLSFVVLFSNHMLRFLVNDFTCLENVEFFRQDDKGETALMLAAANGNKMAIDMILFQVLILCGWTGVHQLISIRNARGHTAKDIALAHRQRECARVIGSFEERGKLDHGAMVDNAKSSNRRSLSSPLEETIAKSVMINNHRSSRIGMVFDKQAGLSQVQHSFRKSLGGARSLEDEKVGAMIPDDKPAASRKSSGNQDRFSVHSLIYTFNDSSGRTDGYDTIEEIIAGDEKTYDAAQLNRSHKPSKPAEPHKSHSVASLLPGRNIVKKSYSTDVPSQRGAYALPEHLYDSDSPASSNCSPSTSRQAISNMICEKSNVESKGKVQRIFNVNHLGKPKHKLRIPGKIRWFLGQQNPCILQRTSSEYCLTGGQSSDSSLNNSPDWSIAVDPTSVDFDTYEKQMRRPSAAVPSDLPSKKPILLRTPKDMLAERAAYQRILASDEDELSNRSVKLPPIKAKPKPSYEC